MLEVGQIAPDFALADQNGNSVSLADFRGKKVVLYFYPKDNTPGCTKQACSFSELIPAFQDENTVVIGISKDSVSSHKKFEENYQLNFTLLSDPDKQVCELYDVLREKSSFGKKYLGVVRSTYLIDEQGIITHALNNVKAAENAAQMLDMVKPS